MFLVIADGKVASVDGVRMAVVTLVLLLIWFTVSLAADRRRYGRKSLAGDTYWASLAGAVLGTIVSLGALLVLELLIRAQPFLAALAVGVLLGTALIFQAFKRGWV